MKTFLGPFLNESTLQPSWNAEKVWQLFDGTNTVKQLAYSISKDIANGLKSVPCKVDYAVSDLSKKKRYVAIEVKVDWWVFEVAFTDDNGKKGIWVFSDQRGGEEVKTVKDIIPLLLKRIREGMK
jgi:hypothetical protein